MRSGWNQLIAVITIWLVAGIISVDFEASDRTSRSTFGFTHHSSAPHSASLELQQALALQQRGAPAAGQGAAIKPMMVEDVFKNVQALKGITVDEFMGTMGLMSAALGFCCSDCHPGAGTQDVRWEQDNALKKTARDMVFMQQANNKTYFQGRQVETCWTCHRGRDFPLVTPQLDAFYGEPTIILDDVITKADGVPTVQQIMDKYWAALGGAQKVAGITSITATGKGIGFGNFGGEDVVEFFAQAPDKRATYIRFPQAPERGDSIRTFDGRTGWLMIPLAPVRKYPLTAGELDGARLDAQLSFPAQIPKVLAALRVGPTTDIQGKSVYFVQGNGARGSLASLYFAQDTGLLVRVIRYTPSAVGKVPTQLDYDDYRDVGGVKFPHKWTFTWLDGRESFQFADVKFNVPIDAAKFAEPNPAR